MTTWSGGYVADLEYIDGFYNQQAPARIVLACLLGGVAIDVPRFDDPVHYLEIGCGLGTGALTIAASNPAWRVTAIDFNPAHIAHATRRARAAGLDNIHFLEADLATLAGSPLALGIPQIDFASMHGVWTWVSREVQQGIVRLLADKMAPGGALHVSYNSLPAWQGVMGFQRLIYESGRRSAGRSDRQVQNGIGIARELKEAGSYCLNDVPFVNQLMERVADLRVGYLSHEYMNQQWAPSFHADVTAAMAEAKLEWAASADPLESFPDLMFTAEQRPLFERQHDPVMRELVKDMCLQRGFRHDVYVRGARRLQNARRDEAIADLTLMPLVEPAELQTNIDVPAGKAELGEALKTMMATVLNGPHKLKDVLASDPGRSNPPELASVMIGSLQAQIMLNPGAEQPAGADRLNRVFGEEVRDLVPVGAALASARLGSGIPVAPAIQFVASRLLAGETERDLDSWVARFAAGVPADKQEEVKTVLQRILDHRVPLLRRAGILPS